jgi:hypothetical protein
LAILQPMRDAFRTVSAHRSALSARPDLLLENLARAVCSDILHFPGAFSSIRRQGAARTAILTPTLCCASTRPKPRCSLATGWPRATSRRQCCSRQMAGRTIPQALAAAIAMLQMSWPNFATVARRKRNQNSYSESRCGGFVCHFAHSRAETSLGAPFGVLDRCRQ